ncbi:MBL fold metallo-hydrolase [Rhizobium sp. EC-SD404]|uniref:MBL fold metallo-hydrolase n=1 Tax=Rhizobium sp. EC-SD404 TaxID=2038389 RepID=UPI00125777F6|nr:MBL fold metallo-hydrolase [Rhizobium sp. EC-SD404]VVT27633.1 Zn-dependent hydrolase, including glyoxylase [Rhizobium sp. EC-SD404]
MTLRQKSVLGASRRDVFKAAGLVAAGLAAPQIMTRAAFAQTETTTQDDAMGQFNRFQLGSFEITTLSDGGRISDDPHTIFGANQPQEDVAALLEENFLPAARMRNTFTPTLIQTGSDLVLFDTGNGEAAREAGAGQMLASLRASGYQPEDVTIVVLTHLHGDHINGLMEGGAPTFANARYVTGQQEFDFWTDDARAGTPAEGNHGAVLSRVAPLAEQMTFIGDGDEVVSGVTGMAAFGHTPGHMIYMIESDDQRVVLTADTANHFVLSLQRPDWEVVYDMDKAAAAETRKRVFDMLATDRTAFIGYHMPFPGVGFVEKLDTGYRFVPKSYQFDVDA